jgi:hypothetical protein
MVAWFNTTIAQGRRILTLAHPTDASNVLGLIFDITAATGKLSAYVSATGNSKQALSSVITANIWQHGCAVFTTTGSCSAYLNGANKATNSGGALVPSGIANTVISGRLSDHTSGIGGQAAHAAVWTRALSDTEVAYLGAGGHPRNIKGLTSYWKIKSAASPVNDEVGTNNLTVTGTTAGTSDPNFQTYMTGGPVGNLSLTVGTPITNIDFSTIFDAVSSAFGVTLQQLAAPTQPTTTASALTAVREVVLTSATGFAAGDYLKITAGGTPTRILYMNGATALVADDQTFASGAAVYNFKVNPATIAGLSMGSNIYSGTPTAATTQALCVFRAACNANVALISDSDQLTITVTGGGGGGGMLMPAGVFSGGFSGG